MDQPAPQWVTQLYEDSVPNWPGELDFYRTLAAEAIAQGGAVLEVACGTGRVAIPLAQAGARVVGLDNSPAMLAVARAQSVCLPRVRWVEGDMRAFALGERYSLVLIPGHSFQFMLTPDDQLACLTCIRQHLADGGRLVVHLDHQDVGWLGDLYAGRADASVTEGLVHPQTGQPVRVSRTWSYEPSTQTALAITVWEELGAEGQVLDRWQRGPVRLHCVFRFEMEHLLARAGLVVEAVYGDFLRGELRDNSGGMIWVARG